MESDGIQYWQILEGQAMAFAKAKEREVFPYGKPEPHIPTCIVENWYGGEDYVILSASVRTEENPIQDLNSVVKSVKTTVEDFKLCALKEYMRVVLRNGEEAVVINNLLFIYSGGCIALTNYTDNFEHKKQPESDIVKVFAASHKRDTMLQGKAGELLLDLTGE